MRTYFLIPTIFLWAMSQEQSDVAGRVLSEDDSSPVVGASVMVEGTFIGTSTDSNGKFFIPNVPLNRSVLQVSGLGFKTEHVSLSGKDRNSIIVFLAVSLIQTQTVVVTANKRAQSLEEIPASMSVIGAQEIERRNSTALDDALRYVPGINFQQSQINIRASSGYSRGVGSRVTLLIDGSPLLAGDTGETIFESVPLFHVDRVEVLKGSGSTLYGSGALGGVVNVLTKNAERNPTVFWRLYSGLYSPPAFDQWKWSDKSRFTNGQVAGFSSHFGDLGLVLSLGRLSDDGYRESDWSRRYNGYVKLTYDVSPFQSLSFSSNFFQRKKGDFLWWKDFQHALEPPDGQRDIQTTSLRLHSTLQYTYVAGEALYIDVKAIHFRGNWYREAIGSILLDQSVSDAAVVDVQAHASALYGHIMTFGLTGNYERVRANIFGSHEGRGGALYIQDEYAISGDLSATAGLRHDFHEVIGSAGDQQTNPKLGIRWSVTEDHTVKISVGRGFRTPSIGELFTTTANTGSAVVVVPSGNLKPEHSWSYEVSSSHTVSPNIQFDLSLFQTDLYGLIEPNVFLDSLPKINFINITQARIQGWEWIIRTLFFERALNVDVHYNYNWATDRNTGAFLRFRPRHIAGINAEFEYSSFIAASDFRFIGRIEQIDNTLVDLAPIKNGGQRVPAYVLDVRLLYNAYDDGLPFRVSFNITNVLGYSYAELIGNVSPPRYFVLAFEGIIQ